MQSKSYYIFAYDDNTDKWNKIGPVRCYDVVLPNHPEHKAFTTKVIRKFDNAFIGWAIYDFVTGAKLNDKLYNTRKLAIEAADIWLGNFSLGSYEKAQEYWIAKWGKANE